MAGKNRSFDDFDFRLQLLVRLDQAFIVARTKEGSAAMVLRRIASDGMLSQQKQGISAQRVLSSLYCHKINLVRISMRRWYVDPASGFLVRCRRTES